METEIHPTWGEYFVRDEVEAAEPDELTVWYLGGNGFVVRSPETTLYIDPFFGDGDPPSFWRMIPVPLDPADVTRCDAVLVTHEHLDHMHPPSYGPLVNDLGAPIYAPESAYERPHWDGDMRVPADRKNVVEPGDTLRFGDVTVHARESNDPDSHGSISYAVEHATGTFFSGGDSRYTDTFHDIGDEFDIDLGSLVFGSFSRIYWSDWWTDDDEQPETRVTQMYMTENDVIKSANALGLDRLLPVHYDLWKGAEGDPKALHDHAASFPYPSVVEVGRVGDRFDIGCPGRRPFGVLDENDDQ